MKVYAVLITHASSKTERIEGVYSQFEKAIEQADKLQDELGWEYEVTPEGFEVDEGI